MVYKWCVYVRECLINNIIYIYTPDQNAFSKYYYK